jgi:hypothetical protein
MIVEFGNYCLPALISNPTVYSELKNRVSGEMIAFSGEIQRRVRGKVKLTCPVSAVVSIGRRNTQVQLVLH